jgi:hypothetical protein
MKTLTIAATVDDAMSNREIRPLAAIVRNLIWHHAVSQECGSPMDLLSAMQRMPKPKTDRSRKLYL